MNWAVLLAVAVLAGVAGAALAVVWMGRRPMWRPVPPGAPTVPPVTPALLEDTRDRLRMRLGPERWDALPATVQQRAVDEIVRAGREALGRIA